MDLIVGRRLQALIVFLASLSFYCPSTDGAEAEEPVTLRETTPTGMCTQVRIELKADGLFQPSLVPGSSAADAALPRPLVLDVSTRLVFVERLVSVPSAAGSAAGTRVNHSSSSDRGAKAAGVKAVRHVIQAASAINGDVRPTASALRPELSLLVAERAETDAGVVVVSPAGPMTRSELELVEGPGDPLLLAEFLPDTPVARGASWKLSRAAALALSGYDTVKSSTLEATLEQFDDAEARVRVKGEVEGAVLGGAGTISCEGYLSFDRKAELVDRLEVNRAEKRQPGPVEAGLDVKSTLRVMRRRVRLVPELNDPSLAQISLETGPERRLLQLLAPDGTYNLLHDRHWHTYWDDRKLVVMKRLEQGKVIAQCNLAAGPNAGAGKHQDLAQFRDDLKRSLRDRFVQFLGAGEVDGDPAGGFRYKVSVQGREGEVGVLWHYYLVASPGGDQLLATFTLAAEDAAVFGGQDLELIGSLQWNRPVAGRGQP